jgi:orotate phosphoribosyltransferase
MVVKGELAGSEIMNQKAKRDALLNFLFKRSFQRGAFELSSGRRSDFYIDVKQTTLDPEGSLLVAEMMLHEVMSSRIDSIGGLTLGADPIIGSVVMLSAQRNHPIRGFIVRKGPKGHGKGGLIEGRIKEGDRVIIIDDVITTGSSAYKAVQAVEELKCKVVKVIPLVDRNEGGGEFFESKGYEYDPIIRMEEIFTLEKTLRDTHKKGVSLSSHPERALMAATPRQSLS